MIAAALVTVAVHCTSGTTVAASGNLRVLAVPFRRRGPLGFSGYREYACLGPHGRPLEVGQESGDAGGASLETLGYAFAGGRYLAIATQDENEGGSDPAYRVVDLKTRRGFALTATFAEPAFRLGAHGTLVTADDGLLKTVARGQAPRTVAQGASAVAVAGTTLYWTQDGAAHSATLPGAATDAPDVLLPPERLFLQDRCRSRRGVTLARTAHVRVGRRGGRVFACRVGSTRAERLPSDIRHLNIAGDRWLFGVDACSRSGLVFDMRSGRNVTALTFDGRWPHTLLDDGTLVWIDDGLFARAPDTEEAELIAPAATALASSGTTVYWTADGAAHSWQAAPRSPAPGAGSWATCA